MTNHLSVMVDAIGCDAAFKVKAALSHAGYIIYKGDPSEAEKKAAKKALNTLATAVLTFAPDLAKELTTRWEAARATEDERLEAFLKVLRGDDANQQSMVESK
jgi:hypothetical protein